MTLTLVFRRTETDSYTAYLEEIPELVTIRGNNLDQVRMDLFTELAMMLSYWDAQEEEITLVTKHWLRDPA